MLNLHHLITGHIWSILNVIAYRLTSVRRRRVIENLSPLVLLKLYVSLDGAILARHFDVS